MKVKELIRALQQFDPNDRVAISSDEEMNSIGDPTIAKLEGDPEYQVVVWPTVPAHRH